MADALGNVLDALQGRVKRSLATYMGVRHDPSQSHHRRARFFEAFWCWREARAASGHRPPSSVVELEMLFEPFGFQPALRDVDR